jgi:hypothetical protein
MSFLPRFHWHLLVGKCYWQGMSEFKRRVTMLATPHARRVRLVPGYDLWMTMVISSLCAGRAYDEVRYFQKA